MVKDEARVRYYLQLWQEWQLNDSTEIGRLGYPSKCLMLVSNGAASFEDMADSAESRAAQIVDTIIEDMEARFRLAIHHFHLAAVWGTKRANGKAEMMNAYGEALIQLETGLNRKGLA